MKLTVGASVAAGAAALALLGTASLSAATAATPDNPVPVTLCVSSGVQEPATLMWRYPEGNRTRWLNGDAAEYFCVQGKDEEDKVSAQALVHFGGPVLHQTWDISVEPQVEAGVYYSVDGPEGAGGIDTLRLNEEHLFTRGGVTVSITWYDNDGDRPKVRVRFAPAA